MADMKAPETCPQCIDESDCSNVDICRAVEGAYTAASAGVAGLCERLDDARQRVVNNVFKTGDDRALMSIPPNPKRDVDLLLTEAIAYIRQLSTDLATVLEREAATIARYDERLAQAERERDAWKIEVERVRDLLKSYHVEDDGAELFGVDEMVSWLKDHRETHADWASWYETHPDDARIKANGTAEFHRGVETRYTRLIASVRALERERDDARKLIYVPGHWRCAKCNFYLVQANLNAHSGTVTARDKPGDKCPNCDVSMWRVTERDNGIEMGQRAEEQFERAQAAEARADALQGRVEKLREVIGYVRAGVDHIIHGQHDTGFTLENIHDDLSAVLADTKEQSDAERPQGKTT